MERSSRRATRRPRRRSPTMPLLRKMRATGRPLILSTGMSTTDEIDAAVEAVGRKDCSSPTPTSTYPCPPEQLNLQA